MPNSHFGGSEVLTPPIGANVQQNPGSNRFMGLATAPITIAAILLLLGLAVWHSFGHSAVLMLLSATLVLYRVVFRRPFSRFGWVLVAIFTMIFMVSGLSYVPFHQLNRAAPSRHGSSTPITAPAVPSDSTGDRVSKIIINGNSYSVTDGKIETIPLVAVTKGAPHKAVVPVQVFVTDSNGKPAGGVSVSVNGQKGATSSDDGSFKAEGVAFENKDSGISGRSDLKLAIGGGAPASVEVWALNTLDGSVGQPALTKEQAMSLLSDPKFVASLETMCPGITLSDIVGVEQTRSIGQSMIAVGSGGQLVNSQDQIPVNQPVWSFQLADGRSCQGQPAGHVVVNPICRNVGGKVPGNSPTPVPTAPGATPISTPTPTPVATPTPTSVPTPVSVPAKNPGNVPPGGGGGTPPPANNPPVPTYTPQPPRGSITITWISCFGGSCTFSWSAPGTTSGWIRWGKAGNSLDHNDTAPQSGGTYSVTESNMVPGTSYQVTVYASDSVGTMNTSSSFTA